MFQIDQAAFDDQLTRVARAVSRRSVLPVLKYVLLQAHPGELTATCTDLTTAVIVTKPAYTEESWTACVRADLLANFVGSLPAGPVKLTYDERTRTLTVSCGQHEAKVKGCDVAEFPGLPEVPTQRAMTLPAGLLARAIGQVAYAVSNEDHRPAMTGVYVQAQDGRLLLTAADGFRLAHTALVLDDHGGEMVAVLRRLDHVPALFTGGWVHVYETDAGNHVVFSDPSTTLILTRIEAQFPDYTAIVPHTHSTRVTMDTRELLHALRMAALFAREGAQIVRLSIGTDCVTLTAAAAEVGGNESVIDAEVDGPAGRIAFNVRYLLDAVGSVDGERVALEMTEAERPGVVRPADDDPLLCVIMPMAIEE